jgi:hypothetical protein
MINLILTDVYATTPPPDCSRPDRVEMWIKAPSSSANWTEKIPIVGGLPSENVFLGYNGGSGIEVILWLLGTVYDSGSGQYIIWNPEFEPGCYKDYLTNWIAGQAPTETSPDDNWRKYTFSNVGVYQVQGRLEGFVYSYCYCAGLYPGSYTYATANVYVVKVDIKRDGNTITNQTTNVDVGDQINLSGVVTPNDVYLFNLDEEWYIPGRRVKNYTYTNQLGQVTPLQQNDLENSAITYYWHDGGDNQWVFFDITLGGKTFYAYTIFNVKRPIATVNPVIQNIATYYQRDPNTQVLYWFMKLVNLGPPVKQGMEISRTAYDANGTNGTTQWAQVINSIHRRFRTNTGVWFAKQGNTVLDSGYPYPYTDGTTLLDSPSQAVAASYLNSEVRDERFSSYLMYKSNKANSIPVPLQRVDWFWDARSSNNGGWGLNQSNRGITANVNQTDFPTWNGNVDDLAWQQE